MWTGHVRGRSEQWLSRLILFGVTLSIAACGSVSLPSDEEAILKFDEGVRFEEQGNLEKAYFAYSEAIKADPRMAEAYANRGHIYFLYDNHVAAMADLNRAIDLNPSLASAFNSRGKTFAENHRPDDALLDFSKAIQLDPGLFDAYLSRAEVFLETGEPEAAIEDITDAIRLRPDSPGLYLTRGRLHAALDQTDRAVADLEQVLALTQNEALAAPARQLLILLQ